MKNNPQEQIFYSLISGFMPVENRAPAEQI